MNFRSHSMRAGLAALTAVLAFSGNGIARAAGPEACADDDLECMRQRHATHPVKDVNYMRAFQALPIDQRVVTAPAKMLDYLNLDNKLHGYPNHPAAPKFGRQLSQDMQGAIRETPAAVRNLVDKQLMGIFLVRDLGGTGYTDYVYDQNHDPVGAFVVFDAEVLTRSANDWATWKENTPFTPDPKIELRATIENPQDDNRRQALQYILLHELGHVASVGRDIHPRWDSWDCRNDPPDRFPFFQLSWELSDWNDCTFISKFDGERFGYRQEVVYYFGARLPAAASTAVYEQLEQTNFPSLYAATTPYDDFAESFVSYVHVVLMGKPFEVRIDRAGKRQVTFAACWGSARCAAKQKLIAALLSSAQGDFP